MKVSVQEVTEITRQLEIALPYSEVQAELDRTYQKIGAQAKLKGFREGKVPRDVLEKHYREEAESEALRNLVSHFYPQAVEEAKISPVSYPEIVIKHYKTGEEFLFQAVVEIRPQVEVKGYVGLTLTKGKTAATDQEIQESLKGLQEKSAQLVPTADGKKAATGDVVIFDYQGIHQGKHLAGGKGDGYVAELGKGALLPEFEKDLVGMTAKEKKEIRVAYPDSWTDKKIAGQEVVYQVHLKEIKEKKLPELNDDFAKDLGNFTQLAEVKDQIRKSIEQEKEHRERYQLSRQIIEQLAEKNKIPVPEGMIQVELESMFHQVENSLRSRGVTLEQAGLKREDFTSQNKEEARFRVQGALLFEAIAAKEAVRVTEEDVHQRIERMAKESGQSEEAWKKYYHENNLIPGVEAAILEEKTLDFILSKAKMKEGKG